MAIADSERRPARIGGGYGRAAADRRAKWHADAVCGGTNGAGSAHFNILPAGKDFDGLFTGSSQGRSANVVLPRNGGRSIRVYLMGNGRDAGKTVGYAIAVSIDAGGIKPAASDSTTRVLEAKCKVAVAKLTGAKVLAIDRIEESEAATGIHVIVQGAQAPWRCSGYRDGIIAT